MGTIGKVFQQTAKLLGPHRKLWIPFLVTAVVEAVLLLGVWLAPHPPFAKVLAPPLRYFFGDRILHYPWHLWFLYHAMKHTHLIATTLVGAFMTGIACLMVRQAHAGEPLSMREALVGRRVRYGTVLFLWLLAWGLTNGALDAIARFSPKASWVIWAAVGSALVLQALLVYAIPAVVYEGSSWWKALLQAVHETLRHPFSTFVIVLLSSLPVILFAAVASESRVADEMLKTAPEWAVAFVAGRLAIWTITDTVMTVAIAHLWWFHRAPQVSAVPQRSGPVTTTQGQALA